ncbi:hypothetical protein PF005_g23023 [Phytophthora fragariae]|nr:hypothetical protein PF003_g38968 [Phytophthora fragariae]KAE8926020.1 hypothetical protein PF009_g23781 [Phytophthora fragariae]KAE8973156.1 hypothetical protein PF011_g25368 [Phytophthora fragariae]KAE9105632.1 hypothetical protein PF010_g12941 [Phytophthora fragariae]KAE9117563.1 hypothetical protein PF007_g9233 [Phytophthora fragariae]
MATLDTPNSPPLDMATPATPSSPMLDRATPATPGSPVPDLTTPSVFSGAEEADQDVDSIANGLANILSPSTSTSSVTDPGVAFETMVQCAENEHVDALAAMKAVDDAPSQGVTDDSHPSSTSASQQDEENKPAEMPDEDMTFDEYMAAQAKKDVASIQAAAELNAEAELRRKGKKEQHRREHLRHVRKQSKKMMDEHRHHQTARKTHRERRRSHRSATTSAQLAADIDAVITSPVADASEDADVPFSAELQAQIAAFRAAGHHTEEEVRDFKEGLKTMSDESFPIEIVHDRVHLDGLGYWYQIRYMDGSEWWNPRDAMIRDNLEENCKIVDDWIDINKRETQSFERYYRGTQTGWNLMNNDCAVVAINALFEASGRLAPITDKVWMDFLSKNHFDKNAGVSMAKVGALLRDIRSRMPEPHVHAGYVSKRNNLYKGNGKGVSGLFRLHLGVGKYFVDCFISGHARHCMVMEVMAGGFYQVFDEGAWIPATEAKSFLIQVTGVYRFVFTGETGVEPPIGRHHKRHLDNDEANRHRKHPRGDEQDNTSNMAPAHD